MTGYVGRQKTRHALSRAGFEGFRDGLIGHIGLPGGTRTPDLLLRRQLLYPVELRADRPTGAQTKKAHVVGLFVLL